MPLVYHKLPPRDISNVDCRRILNARHAEIVYNIGMKLLQLLFVALLATALHGAELANEDKAYGALHGRIAARIQLWPDLAPHETKASADGGGRTIFGS